MFHDDLITDKVELDQWHSVYQVLADAVNVSLAMFLKVRKEVETAAFDSGEDYHVVMLMLLYDFADSIDGVNTLIRVGSSQICALPLRSALELSLSVRFILLDKKYYEVRSLSYEYYHNLDGLAWAQKSDPEQPRGKQVRKELEADVINGELFDVEHEGIDVKKEIEKYQKILALPRYDKVRAEIARLKPLQKCDNWYSIFDGSIDLVRLARKLNLLSMYEALYRPWSKTTHGNGAINRISAKLGKGVVGINPLRNPAGLHEQCTNALLLTLGLTTHLIDKLIPKLRDEFSQWYCQQMKPTLAAIKQIRISG